MIIYAKEKKERALGEKLFLKAHRCNSPKCAMLRRPHKPGVHGKNSRGKTSDFGEQLKSKQKFKLSYGVNEAQLTRIFKEAARSTAGTGEKIMEALERRLDSVIFRSGLADSRIMARHLVVRGHFMVNGVKTVSPSYRVYVGDIISVRLESRSKTLFRELPQSLLKVSVPSWLEISAEKLEAKVVSLPHGIDPPFNIGAVVEYFSKNN